MESSPIHQQVIGEIERFSSRTFQMLTLPKPLEERFERDTSGKREMHLWREGLVAIVLFDLFAIADYFIGESNNWKTILIRLGIVTPLALLVNASMRWKPNKVYREASVVFIICLAGLTHLYLESDKDLAASAYAQAGIIIAILYANVVMRLRFAYALTTTAVLLIGEFVFIQHDYFLSREEEIMGMMLVLCAVLITLIANYSFGRDLRLVYLMLLRNELQSEELAFVNAELHRISSRDNLTGLANRHTFEVYCDKLWEQAVATGGSLSAIVIDIDKFKAVNDFRGHFYGDKVLARVASLLQQSLRGKDDFAARFGGEEFVVLLPETTQRGAVIVAERVRKMVEVAGAPAVDDSQPGPVLPTTISCGVATCRPDANCCMMDLLKAADKAMYDAKRSGRNCVRFGELAQSNCGPDPEAALPTRFGVQSDPTGPTQSRKIIWG